MEYYKGLINSLQRGVVSPVYLFYGEEEYLKEKAVEKFKEFLLPQAADFNLDLLDGEEADIDTVISFAENMPFMAERRLVIVKNAPWFSGKGKNEAGGEDKGSGKDTVLLKYLNNPASTTCLVFVAKEAVDRRKKTYKEISAKGQVIDFKMLKPSEMITWVNQIVKGTGKTIEPSAARAIVEANGKLGLLNLKNEVNKLISYLGSEQEITSAIVGEVGVINIEQNIFTVVDDAVAGHTSKALNGIRELLSLKEQPTKILALLARQLRIALQAEALLREGSPEREVARKMGIHDFVIKKALTQIRRGGSQRMKWALQEIATIDAAIKKGQRDFLPAIETMLIQFGQME
ncbi:DNA polymerase III, delta subunit [Desulforamulus reducens MI-1]|uniref:DNA polymerase III subunit delta n=1 Tax=Desulforamulus reducens (strain ATCC BAA-1160 / DSM 100696 / MI-1) TaxID=349161 RepID=A4J7G3_DESRM|nr:DNA polymerase III subunit delta [Desulforamulus reducens]ABO51016.1 DNA polymerase III, delta subunit [Desulforamulus reducens MI-1]